MLARLRLIQKAQQMRVSSAEFIRNYETLSGVAIREALTITQDGRDRLVLLSAEEYERLLRQDRQVIRVENFTDQEMMQIAASEVPRDHARLDEELADWQP